MPNAGMFQQTGSAELEPSWLPSWPSRGLGYRTASAMQRQSSFSRHFMGAASGGRRRPFSAPSELGASTQSSMAPRTPFTTQLMSISDDLEEKKDLRSALWTSGSGQRRLKGPNRQSPFFTLQKPTCGFNFSASTDHKISKLGIGYADLNKWRFH